MIRFNNKLGSRVLNLVASLNVNYGKSKLVNIILANFDEITVDQTKKILFQLFERGYLIEKNVGSSFSIKVVVLTEKGKFAIENDEDVFLDFDDICVEDFKPAKDLLFIDKRILDDYFFVKKELVELQKREEELKETIKKIMVEKKISEIVSDNLFVYCKKITRIVYPKDKIERFVPEDILTRIRTRSDTFVLSTKFKQES